jgi:hypothetical protein
MQHGNPHADHDPELVAGLLDRDLTGPERVAAETQVAACASCAALLADMRLIATAAVALPTPPRTRDFRLTAVDAAALAAAMAAKTTDVREPVAAATRQTGDMPDQTRDHATHDTLLVAALADRTLSPSDRERAETLVARCSLCAALRDDLVAIRAATRSLPTPPRPHDYQLTAEDAARLRPSAWRRLIGALGATGSVGDLSRPLAMGLTTLGLTGLLVATIPSILTGSAALGPSSGAATVPGFSGAGEGFSSAGPAAVPAAGAAEAPAAGAAAAAATPNGAAGDAASPGAVFAPEASGNDMQIRALAPASTAAASTAAATSAPVFGRTAASPQTTALPGAAAVVQTPDTDGKAGRAPAQPPAAVAPNPAATSSITADGAAERQALDDQSAAETAPSGPSALMLVSGALLLAGLGLFAIRRLGRRPLD